MSEEEEEEEGPSALTKSGKIKRLKQYEASFVASLGGFSLGVCLGWNSSGSETLKNYVNADSVEIGIVGGIFNLGVCIGLTLLPFVLKRFSRTGAMLFTLPVLFLGWICIIFAGQTVPLLLFGRTLCGFSGTFCVLAPIYIAEIADRNIRGSLLCIFQLLVNFGIMFAYSLAHLTTEEKTIWVYSVACAVTTAPIALVIMMPETPGYHLALGNEERAKVSLRYFRGKDYERLDAEIEELKSLVSIKKSNQVTLRTALKDRAIIRSILSSFSLMMMYQFSGITPFIFYTLALFEAGGSSDMSSTCQTMIVGTSQIVGSIIAVMLVDTIGRKALVITSTSLMGLFLVLLGWFFAMQHEDPEYADKLSWMPLTWIALFFASFNLGVGPIAWVYIGEIFPIQVRIEAAVTMAVSNWLLALILTFSFGEILDGLGESNTMWLFGGMCWAGALLASVIVGETKGKSLIELQT